MIKTINLLFSFFFKYTKLHVKFLKSCQKCFNFLTRMRKFRDNFLQDATFL